MKKAPSTFQASGACGGEQHSPLPVQPFCPTWPKKNTLADSALRLLMEDRFVTHPEFERVTASWRLGAAVFTLRSLGWPVKTIALPAPTKNRPARAIALYYLPIKYSGQAVVMTKKGAANAK